MTLVDKSAVRIRGFLTIQMEFYSRNVGGTESIANRVSCFACLSNSVLNELDWDAGKVIARVRSIRARSSQLFRRTHLVLLPTHLFFMPTTRPIQRCDWEISVLANAGVTCNNDLRAGPNLDCRSRRSQCSILTKNCLATCCPRTTGDDLRSLNISPTDIH